MPAHDEEAYLAPAVREVAAGLRSRGRPFEIVVVENGSTDATERVARELTAEVPELRVLTLDRADYGGALREGFLASEGEMVGIFDVDYYDLDFLDRALDVVGAPNGPAIVVASKRGEGAVDTRAWSRRLVTSVFATVLRLGFGLQVSDTHGMKVLRRAPLVELARVSRFGTDLFDTELILRAQRAGLTTREIPVTVEETRPSRTSILRRIPRSVGGLVRLRLALWREGATASRSRTG
ncbi:MAG TPA: glycosyltransferase [Acidimicrobiales bacterium]|nr:glycosyltransferase [Acidimicrobiales bacterium]